MPDGQMPSMPEGGFDQGKFQSGGEPSTDFYMQDMVNAFSGITLAEA